MLNPAAGRIETYLVKVGAETFHVPEDVLITPYLWEHIDELLMMARMDWAVRIEGTPGVGKGPLARLLHALSPRHLEPYVSMNCAGAEDIIESRLFGHDRGVFTDAHRARPGVLESAGRGTLFLDEVGRASLRMQQLLLQVIQDRIYCRMGENEARRFDGKIIAATNVSLEAGVRSGVIQQDFLSRMNAAVFLLPDLARRPEDILPLLDHLVGRQFRRTGIRLVFGTRARRLLNRYTWPGQVREMEQMIDRLAARRLNRPITPGDLKPLDPLRPPRKRPVFRTSVEIDEALKRANQIVAAASRDLDVRPSTIYRKRSKVGV